ncbi:PTS transporter subunit EIIC [uncultured Anaerococcus sp.]|uniref:PTS transporter subunit EIIC n=1 Tax=uncultured Anaerococcus sp. TaxID=293428 RepID=UPI0028895393|nr:PTS transporter subunit EIIC [uncultured Anaerococcus sp.]
MKDKLYNLMQKFSRAIIQPVMFMAAAGILIAFAAILRLEVMPKFIVLIGEFINSVVVSGMIANLSVIFCVGIAVALVPDKKGDTATIAITSFLMFLFANNFWLSHTGNLAEPTEIGLAGTGQGNVLGVQVTDMGVFLGILMGCIVGFVVNRFKNVKYHEYLSMYEGTKTAFLVMVFVSAILGVGVTYVWPIFDNLLNALMNWISDAGPLGFFVYGVVNRLALPFGLHHLLWVPMSYSPVGGSAVINGQSYFGATNIWYAELANLDKITQIDPSIGSLVNFGYTALPLGIALALIHSAKPENKDKVKALIIPAVATSALASITEPIEFIFLFSSPILWIAHTFVYGFGMLISSLSGLRMYVGNIIETTLYCLAVPMNLGKQWLIPIIFVILVAMEYLSFRFLIVKLNLKTLGRQDMPNEKQIREAIEKRDRMKGKNVSTNKDLKSDIDEIDSQMALIIDGLGGADNIKTLENCYTRLRIELNDASKVDREILDLYPSKGIIQSGNNIQIVIGLGVDKIKTNLEHELSKY